MPISATQATGLEDLIQAIHHRLGVTDFPPQTPVAFTDRQTECLRKLATATSKTDAASAITQLLEGPLSV
jgi:hypothetical protein